MFIVGPVLHLLILASTQAHNPERLRADMAELINVIWILLPCDPVLHPRLRALVPERSEELKVYDAEDVVDALEAVVANPGDDLRAQLIVLRLVIARLGGQHSAMRIGRLVTEELRSGGVENETDPTLARLGRTHACVSGRRLTCLDLAISSGRLIGK